MTEDVDDLYGSRRRRAWQRGFQLIRLAMSGNNAMGFVVIIVAFAFIYRSIIERSGTWPYFSIICSLVIGALIAFTGVRTFLRQADLAMLAPTPYPMTRYFRSALTYSAIIQAVWLLLLLMLAYPLYRQTARLPEWWTFTASSLIVLKGWHFLLHWHHVRTGQSSRLSYGARFVICSVVLAGLWEGLWLIACVGAAGAIALTLFTYKRNSRFIPWPTLVALEKKRIIRFYTVLNWFADVPAPLQTVSTRSWPLPLMDAIVSRKRQAAPFLFIRTFVRSGELFGMYIRLIVALLVLIGLFDSTYAHYAICVIGIWVTSKQLSQLPLDMRYPRSMRLLPVGRLQQQKAYASVSMTALLLMTLLLAAGVMIKDGLHSHTFTLIAITAIWSWILGVRAGSIFQLDAP